MSNTEGRGKNIIILEGGGVGGLSPLFILGELMNRVKAAGGDPSILKQFALVAGAGTGGVQACMLGRLRIQLDQVIPIFMKLLEDVFSEKKISMSDSASFKATHLEAELKKIVKNATGDENARMITSPSEGEGCKTMIFAMSKHNMNASTPRIFRSYQGPENQIPDCTIWEALRATMAHPNVFKSIEIGEPGMREEFVGGDIGCSNPVSHVLAEAALLYPNNHIASIVCIGAGHTRTIHIPKPNPLQRILPINILIAMKDIATDSERAAQDMATRFQGTLGVYFRFSVDQGMQNVKMSEWQRQSEVVAHTRAYMQRVDVNEKISSAAQAVKEQKNTIGVGYINGRVQQASAQEIAGVNHCPMPSPLFTGCESQVSQVASCLVAPTHERRICVIHGLGGAGKTQIALQVVENTKDRWVDVVYVDATSRETTVAALKSFALAKRIGKTHEDAVRWLESYRQLWLIVFDNADDPGLDLASFIPQGSHGSVLITTRLRNLALLGQGPHSDCSVGNMDESDALELLLKKSRQDEQTLMEDEREAAVKLVQDLGYLALAVVHAGAYIWCSKRSIASYRQECLEHRQSALERYSKMTVNVEQYKKTVYTTWLMSYERLEKPTQLLLCMLGFLHHEGITEDIFRRAATNKSYFPQIPLSEEESIVHEETHDYLKCFLDTDEEWDSDKFSIVMDELMSYSLIDYDRANRAYNVHVLVQEWARMVAADRKSTVLNNISFLISLSSDRCSGTTSRRLLPHVNGLLSQQVEVSVNDLVCFARVYSDNGQWKHEEKLCAQVASATKRVLGEDHPHTLTAMANLAATYRNQGRWKEAEALQVQVLGARKRVLGEDHPHTLTAMGSLAATHCSQGRWKEAEALEAQVLSATKRVLGEYHPHTLTAMANLAATYRNQGRWREAEALQVQVLSATKRVLGEDHPDTITAMGNLAATYWNQGRWKEAEALEVQVLSATKRVLGEDHPNTLIAMGSLAGNYRNQGRWREAEALQVQVLSATKRVLGKDHPDTLTAMSSLAATYWNQGRWKEAEILEVQVLSARKQVLGEDHPHTLTAMGNLAATHWSQGRWKEAEALEAQVLSMRKRVLGDDHPDTLNAMASLAATYRNQGRWREAEALEVQVLSARKRVLGDDHPDTITAMGNLAATYKNQGRWKEAEALEVQVLSATKQALGEDHPHTRNAMANLAVTYRNQGRWKELEALQVQVLGLCRRSFGEEHEKTLESMRELLGTYKIVLWKRYQEYRALRKQIKQLEAKFN